MTTGVNAHCTKTSPSANAYFASGFAPVTTHVTLARSAVHYLGKNYLI